MLPPSTTPKFPYAHNCLGFFAQLSCLPHSRTAIRSIRRTRNDYIMKWIPFAYQILTRKIARPRKCLLSVDRIKLLTFGSINAHRAPAPRVEIDDNTSTAGEMTHLHSCWQCTLGQVLIGTGQLSQTKHYCSASDKSYVRSWYRWARIDPKREVTGLLEVSPFCAHPKKA